ncbi:pentapeptide repeat-containing protein [Nocardia arthritidis]|uniref:Pentapeptide repeat-containing protein n=1 Tax=Nocardia arthritidis TaxID=228602 RepID=A0A6G9Y6L2_9NOCA|nr:pentapeptide repeat-containing protein [Nocardia arthritidis]QIS08740.1 pentapeptide repeat-containing protein [Nocardia arthritidis]
MADRRNGEQPPPTEHTIRGEDWYGRELVDERHTRVEFLDVDMSETATRNTVFTECAFRNVNFSQSVHRSTAFLNCTFTACRFFETEFTTCKLTGSMFDRCTFTLFEAIGGDWSFVGLPGADLRGTTFTDLRMREADLTFARCQKATFRDVDLSGAWLSKADFTESDLRGSDLTALDPLITAIARAIIDPDQAIVLATALGVRVLPG